MARANRHYIPCCSGSDGISPISFLVRGKNLGLPFLSLTNWALSFFLKSHKQSMRRGGDVGANGTFEYEERVGRSQVVATCGPDGS